MISDDDFLSIVRRDSETAESYVTSEISEDREQAIKRYLGEPYGDEEAGQSAVVSWDLFEAIEWVMPSILKVFASNDDVAQYEPETEEDVGLAEQATDVANYVFYRKNPGFIILNTWFKDALLSKQGVVKSWWDESEVTEYDQRSELTNDEYKFLLAQEDVKITAVTAYTMDGEEIPSDEHEAYMELGLPMLHSVDAERKVTKGQIRTMNVPPEEFYMSRDAMDPDTAHYLEHRTRQTESQLVAAGFDRMTVESLPSDNNDDPSGERSVRFSQAYDDEDNADGTMREITVYESYCMVDADEDGIAERWKVTWAGNEILDKEKNSHQPFSVITPITVPHRAYGLSFADIINDLQRIKTTILRQTLNNLYLSNNPEREVVVDQVHSMDDFLMTRPGGLKRVKAINASREISHPFVAQHSYAMLDGIDTMISARSGVTEGVTGVDAEVLQNETATASNNQAAAASQRIDMYVRIIAETGVKHLFKLYLHLMVNHQKKAETIRLRNKWVEIKPDTWNANMDVTVDVGLGHGNKDQQVQHLMGIMEWQKGLLGEGGLGMVKPKHLYNTMEKMVKSVGFKSVDAFLDDPGDEPMQQPQQQDPNAALIQGQLQIETLKAQGRQQEMQMKMSAEERQAERDHQIDVAKLRLEAEKVQVSREKIAADMKETAAKIDADKDKAAAQLYASSQKIDAEADQKERDRLFNLGEKDKDRAATMAAATAPKTLSMNRNPDGSMTGVVNGGE